MTSKKTSTAKNASEAHVTLTYDDGQTRQLTKPITGHETEEQLTKEAIEYAHLLRRVDAAWIDTITDERAATIVQGVAKAAALDVVQGILDTLSERYPDTKLRGEPQEATGEGATKFEGIITRWLEEDGAKKFAMTFEKQVTARIVEELEQQPDFNADEYAAEFKAAWETQYEDYAKEVAAQYGTQFANAVLEELKPSKATRDQLVAMLQGETGSDTAWIGTHPLSNAMTRGLIQPALNSDHAIRMRKDGSIYQARVRTEVAVEKPSKVVVEQQEAIMLQMQRSLLRDKEHSAANLKMHLDLMNQAYQTAGNPVFLYNLDEALERQGYARQKKGSFHHETLRNARRRLHLMYAHKVRVWNVKNDEVGQELIARTPYWVIEETYSTRKSAAADEITPSTYSLEGDEAFHSAMIRPGNWWTYADMQHYKLPVPPEILQLKTDGRGNERERMALLIATYLATYVRTNHGKSAETWKGVSVGALLEGSGIATRKEFFELAKHPARRLRNYLLNEEGEGALRILTDLGAFSIDVRDWNDFYATGRGWQERFWEASLKVFIPDLGFKNNALPAKSGRRRRA